MFSQQHLVQVTSQSTTIVLTPHVLVSRVAGCIWGGWVVTFPAACCCGPLHDTGPCHLYADGGCPFCALCPPILCHPCCPQHLFHFKVSIGHAVMLPPWWSQHTCKCV